MNKIIYRIQEIGEVCGGGTPRTTISEYWDGDIPWISPDDLTDYKSVYIKNGKNFITKLGYKNSSTKMLPKGTLLFSSRAPIGYIAIAENPICTNQGFKSIILNDKVNNLYFYYWLKCNLNYIKLFGTGATFPEISGSRMKRIKVEIFENIEYQQKIAMFLGKYDQLIENNNKRIKLLEQMAEELYKEWFVRFRFPGYEKITFKDSELGKIPSSFNIVKINEVLEYYVGGGWGNDNFSSEYSVPAYVIRGADFPLVNNSNVSSCPYRFHKSSNFSSRKLKENDIVFEISGGTAEQPVGRAILVTKGILNQLNDNVICASFCKLIRPNYNEVKPNYFYQWLKFLYDTRIIERFQLQSTGIINFKFEYFLRKGSVLIPPIELMEKYEELVRAMRDEIDKLAIENTLLKKQRDSLLPRLMSGKVDLEDKEVI